MTVLKLSVWQTGNLNISFLLQFPDRQNWSPGYRPFTEGQSAAWNTILLSVFEHIGALYDLVAKQQNNKETYRQLCC